MPSYIGVLAVDLPGHGRSSHLPDGIFYHTIYNFMYCILLIMKEYNWDKVSIMAHSMSSMLGFVYASIYPEKVDLFIGIDLLKPMYRRPAKELSMLRDNFENFYTINEMHRSKKEPPSYLYAELIAKLYEVYQGSINYDKLHHILDRNITKSTEYPDKYYFSRDGRLKSVIEISLNLDQCKEMAIRIKNPYLLIKGGASKFFSEGAFKEITDILRTNNPHFEAFVLPEGRHHLHLNNPDKIAPVINAFIEKHRPNEKKVASPSKL